MITPEMAAAEIARRQALGGKRGKGPSLDITPEMAAAEIERRKKTQPSRGILEQAAESPITQAILNIGGALAETPQRLVKAVGEIPTELGLTSYRGKVQPAPFVDRSSLFYQIPSLGVQAAPILAAAPELGVAKGVEMLPQLARALGMTAATTPGTPAHRVVTGAETAAFGGALPYAGAAAKATGKGTQRLFDLLRQTNVGKAVASHSQNAMKIGRDLFDDLPLNKTGDIVQRVGDTLRKNLKKHTKSGSTRFNKSLGNYKDLDIVQGRIKQYKVADKINSLLEKEKGAATGALKRAVTQFQKTPTYGKLHELQSSVGNKLREMKSVASAEQDGEKIEALEKIRTQILDHIQNTLPGKRGANYGKARKYWAKNVIPYTHDNIINKTAFGGKNPESLTGRLTQFESQKAKQQPVNTALSHMKPNEIEQIMAVPLKDAFTTTGEAKPQTLMDALDKLGSGKYGRLMDKSGSRAKIEKYIEGLRKTAEKIEKEKALSDKVRKTTGRLAAGVGTGLGAALGFEGGRHLLE